MSYYNPGTPEVRTSCLQPPYNSPLNPNYSTFATLPQFPLNAGSNAQQIQQAQANVTYFNYINQQASDSVNLSSTTNPIPFPVFKSESQRIAYLQGQTITAARMNASQGQVACDTIYDIINSPNNYPLPY